MPREVVHRYEFVPVAVLQIDPIYSMLYLQLGVDSVGPHEAATHFVQRARWVGFDVVDDKFPVIPGELTTIVEFDLLTDKVELSVQF